MLPGYMDGISQAGGIPVVFPFSANEQELDQLMNLCSGFLLPAVMMCLRKYTGKNLCPDWLKAARKGTKWKR